ncbi:MAG: oligosaccharide flippase family protein [Geobacteraceae bacterium]|nr:oligosaccharide flippase family protein [Geobacteraceae bacterium]
MKNKLIKNASSSVVQFMFNSVILFVFYKFLLKTIGAKDIGIWSLVLGISSLSQVAAFGFSGGAVKYVAQYLSRQENDKVSAVIQTSLISVGFLVGIFVALGYPLFRIFIIHASGTENTLKIEQILPLGMVCLWLMVLVNVAFSSLDGYQRMYLRNYVFVASAGINLLLCFFVVPRFQLLGLAYLSLFQNSFLLISSWILLKRLNPCLPAIPFRWNKSIFKEVLGYNVKFQLISFTTMLCEPTTKYFLGIFGGIASVGYYEMASRLAGQVRGVLVSANQAIVPTIAVYVEQEKEKVRRIYINSFHLLLFIVLPVYCILLLAVPLISHVWIGSSNVVFMLALHVLLFAHMINILSNPAYFSNLGTGWLSVNLFAHVSMAITNLLLAYILGNIYGGQGVIIAWAVTLVLGSAYICCSYHRKHNISIKDILPSHFNKMLFFVVAIFALGKICLWMSRELQVIEAYSLVIGITAASLFYHQWKHPFFSRLSEWFIHKGTKA